MSVIHGCQMITADRLLRGVPIVENVTNWSLKDLAECCFEIEIKRDNNGAVMVTGVVGVLE